MVLSLSKCGKPSALKKAKVVIARSHGLRKKFWRTFRRMHMVIWRKKPSRLLLVWRVLKSRLLLFRVHNAISDWYTFLFSYFDIFIEGWGSRKNLEKRPAIKSRDFQKKNGGYFGGCTRSFDRKKKQANAFESESQENTTPLGDCLVWRVLNSKLQLH